MRESKTDFEVRSDKTHGVIIKMAFLVFEKSKFPQYFEKRHQKLKFFEIILKIHPPKRENVFEKLNHLSFVNWAVVAARLRSLRKNAPWTEGHSRLVDNQTENSRLKISYI